MANPAPDLDDDRDIFAIEDLDAKRRAIAKARTYPADSYVPLADVMRWMESWGKPDELPPPPWK